MKGAEKIAVIGLDCLSPRLLDVWSSQLPTFRGLAGSGYGGVLRSVDPPITVPAWSSMTTGLSPKQLGLYGFRHRRLGSYEARYVAFGDRVRGARIWDRVGEQGGSSLVLAVPQTYPLRALRGVAVAGFLTPDYESLWTWPDPLREEIEDEFGEYIFDVEHFRDLQPAEVLARARQLSHQRFALFRYLHETRSPRFSMMVDIGPDRVHHALWSSCDPSHPRHQEAADKEAVLGYYQLLDRELGLTLEGLRGHHVFVVSDHGARALQWGFAINDWLRQRGWLVLKEPVPEGPCALRPEMIDWSRTQLWAWGGYYARIFVNLRGREAQGLVAEAAVPQLFAELREALAQLRAPDGSQPEHRFIELLGDSKAQGDPPDMMVYLGGLDWRALGSVGLESLFVRENDTGRDEANHDPDGVLLYRPPVGQSMGLRSGPFSLLDLMPSWLQLLGMSKPAELSGVSIFA